MKRLLEFKKLLGSYVYLSLEYWDALRGHVYDARMYWKHAILGWRRKDINTSHLEALIIKEYHMLEKGLGMAEMKPKFGIRVVQLLFKHMKLYLEGGGELGNVHFQAAADCLIAYKKVNGQLGVDVTDLADFEKIEEWSQRGEMPSKGGIDKMTPTELFSFVGSGFSDFVKSRRSCRFFNGEQIADEQINEAVKLATYSPSVCNRQAWRVHQFNDAGDIKRLLLHQNGNRGFGHQIPCLLVITMDLHCFDGAIERYQPWIDGGMFSMNLLLALHSMQLGAVPLNWSASHQQDKMMRKEGLIPENELVMMMVGVGQPADLGTFPKSQRRDVAEILQVHNFK